MKGSGRFCTKALFKSWASWATFVGLLILYQGSQVYLEETIGRDIERKHIQQQKWTKEDVFILSCYNFYKWLGTILHILVAVTRVDVWLLIAFVDTVARAIMWQENDQNGRRPRTLYTLL